jgi:mannose-6-phosphate isomerase-like protein (cupin superfamily)
MSVLEREQRPWGSFDVLVNDPHTKVKRITVQPGQRLSLQSHTLRKEFWTVVKGVATVTVDDVVRDYGYGETVTIPLGAIHRLQNATDEPIEVIEVQVAGSVPTGDVDYFPESDIKRYSDDYNRADVK